jgi:hypothetical protein
MKPWKYLHLVSNNTDFLSCSPTSSITCISIIPVSSFWDDFKLKIRKDLNTPFKICCFLDFQIKCMQHFTFLWSWLSRKLKLTSFIISIKGYAERCMKRPQYVDKGKLNKCILKSKCGHCILLDTVICSDHCILDIYLVLLFRMLNVLPNMWNFGI